MVFFLGPPSSSATRLFDEVFFFAASAAAVFFFAASAAAVFFFAFSRTRRASTMTAIRADLGSDLPILRRVGRSSAA